MRRITNLIRNIGSKDGYYIVAYVLSFFNYFGIALLFAILYDIRNELVGGPLSMITFFIGPVCIGILVFISALVISSLKKKGFYTAIGWYCIIHYMISIIVVIWIEYDLFASKYGWGNDSLIINSTFAP